VYSDRVLDPALTGVGDFFADNGEVLPYLYPAHLPTGEKTGNPCLRLVFQRNSVRCDAIWIRYGGVLDFAKDDIRLQDRANQFWFAIVTP